MTKTRYLKHKMIPTELGRKVLRARLSLRETQLEFAERFQVTNVTVHNWETGRTTNIQRIHRAILDNLIRRLKDEGRWMPDDIFITIYRTEAQNDALADVSG